MRYKLTVGLETHIELSTKTKMFCGCKTKFGAEPNSRCCPVCLGLPGSLPVLNKKAVESAIKAGLATGCSINTFSKLDRKNYFYLDLAKAYQVSQYYMPLCKNGGVKLACGKTIKIIDIHIEEDAGKIIYKDGNVLIDYNRSGVPLIEVVTEPDIQSSEEAVEYVDKLIKIMRYIGVSDCKMEEGSVRFDVNISVSSNEKVLGTKVEIKNINSLKNLKKAIEFERDRQISVLESGKTVKRETRRFDEETCETKSMRDKETATDYRYFADPDLPPIRLTEQWVSSIKSSMPVSLDEKIKIYTDEYGICAKDAETILKYEKVASFFEESSKNVKDKRIVLNFILGEIFSNLKTEKEKQNFEISLSPDDLRSIALMVEQEKMTLNLAKERLRTLIKTGVLNLSCDFISEEHLLNLINNTLDLNMGLVQDYLNGKTAAIEPLIGLILRQTGGQADPEEVRKKLTDVIKTRI